MLTALPLKLRAGAEVRLQEPRTPLPWAGLRCNLRRPGHTMSFVPGRHELSGSVVTSSSGSPRRAADDEKQGSE